ncbi:hypothetical protein Lfu02_31370 [Longispora fulva]|nr:hypothetical protein Lfu02_31370 [Longispora fulva]
MALVIAYRKQRVTEAQNILAHVADERAAAAKILADAADARAALESDRTGVRIFNERYAKAVEQLGNDKAAVRLGGVYALAGLADDWEAGRRTCIDVLCAYLRMPYAPPPDLNDERVQKSVAITGMAEWLRKNAPAKEEQQVRFTIIHLIGAHLRDTSPVSWQGHDFDFTGAIFDGGDFGGAVFSGGTVSFKQAKFTGGNTRFQGATFSGAAVSFVGAEFAGGVVQFSESRFMTGLVDFQDSGFTGSDVLFDSCVFASEVLFSNISVLAGTIYFGSTEFLDGAQVVLEGCNITDGALDFSGAEFSGGDVYFDGSEFIGGEVKFTSFGLGATFSGGHVRFNSASFSGSVADFRSAIFSGGEVSMTDAEFEVPPLFPDWPSGPPKGLTLPAGMDARGNPNTTSLPQRTGQQPSGV